MNDQGTAETSRAAGEDHRGARDKVSDGIRDGLGVLSVFRDALEETIVEARERLGGVSQKEFDLLKAQAGEFEARLNDLERRVGSDPGGGPTHSHTQGN